MWNCTPEMYDKIKYKNRERMIKIYKALKHKEKREYDAAIRGKMKRLT